MLRDIIKKEILDNILSPKFVFTFLLCSILILLSTYTGITNYVADKKEYDASIALSGEITEKTQGYLELLSNRIIYKPPRVLGTIVKGIEDAVGRSVPLSGSTNADVGLTESKYESNLLFSIFGTIDLLFIVKIVLSLFAILFTYDVVVGEKEKGTLKLSLANSVPRDRIILGKAIGNYISLLLPLLVPLLLSLIVLMFIPEIELTGEDWIRLLLIFLMFFAYLSVFFSLGLFISTKTSRSSTSFLVLLVIWVVFVMVIPRGAVLTAGQLRPIQSIHEISAKKRELADQTYKESQKRQEEFMRKANNEEEWIKVFKEFRDEEVRTIAQNNAAIDKDNQLRKREQQNLAVNLSRISPASALTFGSMSLACTGIDDSDQFLASVQAYKPEFRLWYNSKNYSSDRLVGKGSEFSIDDMPRHSFKSESLGNSMLRALPDFALMLAMIVVFFIGAYVSFLRYDIR